MFALFYDAKTKNVTALNGSGRAPAALTTERIQREGLISNPYHAHNVTVPGACTGWCDLIARHGTMPLRDILAPAIELAEKGFPVAPITAYFWQRGVERPLKNALNGHELTIGGRAPNAGDIFATQDWRTRFVRLPKVAKTRTITVRLRARLRMPYKNRAA